MFGVIFGVMISSGSRKKTALILATVLAASALGAAAERARAGDDAVPAGAAAKSTGAAAHFTESVAPLLASRCVRCHGPKKQKGGLRLDSRAAALEGGGRGRVLVPGEPAASVIVQAVRHSDPDLAMPPDEMLEPAEIAAIEEWVRLEASAATAPDRTATPSTSPTAPADSRPAATLAPRVSRIAPPSEAAKSWWAIRPLGGRPPRAWIGQDGAAAGAARASGWARGPIDAFVLDALERAGLEPSPAADRRTLLRRIAYDLLGLPPGPEDLAELEADTAPDAWSRLVDRFLASPRYGERAGRAWLDVVRYAESDGFRADEYRPNAWKYRDWVISALDDDKPFDRFIAEQIAGDELYPDETEAIIAAGYLRLWPYEHNQRDLHRHRDEILNDITDVTSEAFLAISLRCARCHDHKFDPLLQEDYFRLRAFFAGVLPLDGIPAAPRGAVREREAAMERWREATRELRGRIEEIEAPVRARLEARAIEKLLPEYQALLRKSDSELSPAEVPIRHLASLQLEREVRGLEGEIPEGERERWKALRGELARFDHLRPPPLPTALSVVEVGTRAPPTSIADAPSSGAADLEPGFLAVLGEPPPVIEPAMDRGPAGARSSSGRRSALARWLGRDDHPLVLRAAVNRIWQQHFGRGIAPSANDFGRLGEPPTHPELLDWLARELVRGGRGLKRIHREILLSSTFQQSSSVAPGARGPDVDPDNLLLWRMPLRRLEAEAIRDSMLAASGELDLRAGGPAADEGTPRRAVYLKVLRNSRVPLLEAFDAPDASASCSRREVTTSAPQALLLLNLDWTQARARALADDILRTLGPEGAQDATAAADAAFRRVLGRAPAAAEREAALNLLGAETASRLPELCLGLLNTNELVHVD